MNGTLYVVATPIGNLGDITYRAVDILKNVDVILCEDTRLTKHLLDTYGVSTKTMSYHAKSTLSKADVILRLLEEGKNLALVSDAGTPCISDPGSHLINYIRERNPDIAISPIPGASAITALMSVSGIFGNSFIFEGFIPQKKGRKTFFESLGSATLPVIMYESSHRIIKAMKSFKEYIPDREIVIGKELTKIHEHVLVGKADDHLDFFAQDGNRVKGEFVIVVKP